MTAHRETSRLIPAPRALFAAFAAMAALGACAGPTLETNYDLTHEIRVEVAPKLIEIAAAAPLSTFDKARVDAFAIEYRRVADGPITIAYPDKGAPGLVVKEVAERLFAAGVAHRSVVRGPYSVAEEGDRGVVVSFEAPEAIASECPEVKGDATLDVFNRTPGYFGCATRKNLAAMVADPRDLISPRPATPPLTARRTGVIYGYAAGEETASENGQEATETTKD